MPRRSPYDMLRILLSHVTGATFLSLDTLTPVTLKGGEQNPFYGRVTKQTTAANVMIFQNKRTNGYENMVQRRLIDEGKDPTLFELKPRAWGTRLPDCPFVQHETDEGFKYYLEVIILREGHVQFLVDGFPFKGEIPGIEEHTPPAQGGLDNTVVVRCYACEHITGIQVSKEYTRLT